MSGCTGALYLVSMCTGSRSLLISPKTSKKKIGSRRRLGFLREDTISDLAKPRCHGYPPASRAAFLLHTLALISQTRTTLITGSHLAAYEVVAEV